ncbi:MAG: insulinase family protein [Muribaculaceae bacterium]|nr:insulinase family protein [Muribaculaceae bacterium]
MIEYRTYTLPNGLRVVHNYDPATVMAAVDVLYNTGARDESRSLTGIAHLFEHLMFGGSRNVPDFDKVLQNAGGQSNAWTSNDFTNFYDVLPAANVATALYLESDRMEALGFNHEALEVQRSVVTEEFKQQCLNRPYGLLMHTLREALYAPGHPYSWPVIGLAPEHIARVTDDDVRAWFYGHYAPDNAVLAISGNVPYGEGRGMVERWFGDIPRRDIPARKNVDPGFPAESVSVELFGNAPMPMVALAIPMDSYGTKNYRVADCITDILSAGQTSRFYRNLVLGGNGLIVDADASITGSESPGFVMMTARVSQGTREALEEAAAAMLGQLEALATDGGVTPHELERTMNRFESTFALSNLDALSKAQNLAMCVMHGEDINSTVELQRQITRGDIAAEAARLASVPRATVFYRPKQS